MDYKLRWSDESIRNLEEILGDISNKWSEREVNNFKIRLSRQLNLIIQHPYMSPIFLAYLHINGKDISGIK